MRAEEVRDEWFPAYDIADCVIEEINPIEAGNAALAHYRPPAGDGSRPGAHCVLTTDPQERFVYEYEALAFHESTPGHHLQIASAQTLTDLPDYRRFLDAEVCGYVEGWGLYSERLADEMGLYTSDLSRFGMLSFDALRACRLVVDTGMHHLGWSRQQAMDFMWDNTATTRANVRNEIDRYISWPGQALAYMIGRREIRRLRAEAQDRARRPVRHPRLPRRRARQRRGPARCSRSRWIDRRLHRLPSLLLPNKERTCSSRSMELELNVEVLGEEGVPVLIAHHGGGGIGSLAEPKSTFGPLSDLFRVIVFDARGCGLSEGVPPYSHAQWAADVDGAARVGRRRADRGRGRLLRRVHRHGVRDRLSRPGAGDDPAGHLPDRENLASRTRTRARRPG